MSRVNHRRPSRLQDEPDGPPDWFGLSVRFTCGAVFGFLAGLSGGWYLGASVPVLIGVCLVAAVVVGMLAAWIGDRFWRHIWLWAW